MTILEQPNLPGEPMQTDGAWLTELAVTIQGEPFKYILICSVLPYSNWEWGRSEEPDPMPPAYTVRFPQATPDV